MVREFKIILDYHPDSGYTFEYTVSGRVIFESSHEEKLGWVYVFFHGWVNVEIPALQAYSSSGKNPKPSDKSKDKEILFQNHLKVYDGDGRLQKNFRYEWPFQFNFQAETYNASSLPSSGHYSFTNEKKWWSSVQYRLVAAHGDIGQSDDHIRWMLNPNDVRYQKEPILKLTGILLKIREKLAGDTEQELKFAQIRTSVAIDTYMCPPLHWNLEVSSQHVPQLAPAAFYDDLQFQRTTFPFSVDLQMLSNIIIEEPFSLLLSVSSKSNIWNANLPTVTLTSFKIKCLIQDKITIGEQPADDKFLSRPVWEGKRLQIPLSSTPVDIGKIYSFTIAGEDIVQSFDTSLLHRSYSFLVELTVEVGGKSFQAMYTNDPITLLSPRVASSAMLQPQPRNDFKPDFKQKSKQRFQDGPIKVQLQGTYIGRLTHDGAGLDRPVSEHSIMEAAIALSRALTDAGIQHSFPGGTLIQLHPYNPQQIADHKTTSRPDPDDEQLQSLFEQHGSKFHVLEPDHPFEPTLSLRFKDRKHKEHITIEFPSKSLSAFYHTRFLTSHIDLQNPADLLPLAFSQDKKGDSYSMNLSPVILFNYRLWCLATHERFGEKEFEDIEALFETFTHDLRRHRQEINVKFAKVALRTHPELKDLPWNQIGVDLSRAKGTEAEPWGEEDERAERGGGEEELPPYDPGLGRGYEHGLAQGMQGVHLRAREPVPTYESGPSKHQAWDKDEY
jgi:hypothetical protein